MKKVMALLCGIVSIANITYSQNGKERKAYIDVINVSYISLDVKCARTENSLADSSINFFCWDVCFIPSIDSSGIVTIGPGQTSQNYIGYYDPNGGTGMSSISYCFYDNNNPIDSACVTILYSPDSPDDSLYATVNIGTLVGIDDHAITKSNRIVDIYPNPAKTNATVAYSLARGVSEATIVVRDLLGSQLLEVQLKGSTGKVIFPVSNMNRGIYFYSLIVNGQVQSTQKLVVK